MSGLSRPRAGARGAGARAPAPGARLLGCLLALCLAAPAARGQAPPDPPAGAALYLPAPSAWAAPDFALPTDRDTRFRLSDHRGRVVLVNFWATWCAPCLREIPDLIRLRSDLGPFGLDVVGVSVDEGGWDVVRPFAARLAIPYPLVLDDGRTGAAFGSSEMMPTTFVVDRQGMIRLVEKGAFDPRELRPILEALLAEGHPCVACARVEPAPLAGAAGRR